jgi:hypothetical protein
LYIVCRVRAFLAPYQLVVQPVRPGTGQLVDLRLEGVLGRVGERGRARQEVVKRDGVEVTGVHAVIHGAGPEAFLEHPANVVAQLVAVV